MKLKRWSQSILAATASICAGTGLVSCGTSNTVDYLYATSSKSDPGVINVFRVDSQSGALTAIPENSYPAGRTPVSLAADAVGKNLYVVNFDDNTLVQYGIGTDAKLYPQTTVNPSGSDPVAVTVHSVTDSSGNLLYNLVYVVETYQPDFTAQSTGPGALYVYKTDANGVMSTPVTQTVNGVSSSYVPLGNAPTAVNVTTDGLQVFATDLLTSTQTTNPACPTAGLGGLQAYNQVVDSSGNPTGVLTAVTGSPFCAGTAPSALASHPYSTFLYVTDSAQNQVITYGINKSAAPGVLTNLPSGPVATGTTPDGIVVDPRGLYVYVTNKIGGTVQGYGVNLSTGGLSSLATNGTGTTGAYPGCVIVEPALGRFVYTANFAGNSISGFILDPNTGGLSATQNTFYDTSGLTQCVAAVSHGNHPIIHVQNVAGSGS
ncbi:beta-propeller fold lactonase family protein [Acidipila sp. EB88]|uniref:lactonase family protein n=1 Tax=Acidipila sp. EB88 TaxID=2305226 RepID=UPI000F5F5572|nr:beta-propeller fold lactonase family protein [Acidipila sp. EB88]RRA48728.1 hypothetical protein D1Y84_10980 [Acidipila sp. EB88]